MVIFKKVASVATRIFLPLALKALLTSTPVEEGRFFKWFAHFRKYLFLGGVFVFVGSHLFLFSILGWLLAFVLSPYLTTPILETAHGFFMLSSILSILLVGAGCLFLRKTYLSFITELKPKPDGIESKYPLFYFIKDFLKTLVRSESGSRPSK